MKQKFESKISVYTLKTLVVNYHMLNIQKTKLIIPKLQ
jgi:hypothetical protein